MSVFNFSDPYFCPRGTFKKNPAEVAVRVQRDVPKPSLGKLYPAVAVSFKTLKTVEDFTSLAAAYRAIDSTERVTVDDCGNTAPACQEADHQLYCLGRWCAQIAWQPAARAELKAAGLL